MLYEFGLKMPVFTPILERFWKMGENGITLQYHSSRNAITWD